MRAFLVAFGATALMFVVKAARDSIRHSGELRPVRQATALDILRERNAPISSFQLCRLVDERVGGGLASAGEWLNLMDDLCEHRSIRKVWRDRAPGEPRWFGYEMASS